jgi:hypothetical protein
MNNQNIVTEVNDYDLSFVKVKFDLEHPDLTDISDKLLIELKRWMSICLIYPQKSYQMFGPVDEMWHTFIMFTYEYRKFCYTYGEFVHHFPELPIENQEKKELNLTGYETFLADYKKQFGDVDAIWPTINSIKAHPPCLSGGGGGCRKCHRTCHKT